MSWPLSCSPWCHSVVERCKSLSRKNIFIVLGLSQRTDCIIYNYFNKEILWLEFSSRCQFVGREIYTWYELQYHMVPPYWWLGKRDVIDWKRPPWRFLRRSVSGHRRPCQPGGGSRHIQCLIFKMGGEHRHFCNGMMDHQSRWKVTYQRHRDQEIDLPRLRMLNNYWSCSRESHNYFWVVK